MIYLSFLSDVLTRFYGLRHLRRTFLRKMVRILVLAIETKPEAECEHFCSKKNKGQGRTLQDLSKKVKFKEPRHMCQVRYCLFIHLKDTCHFEKDLEHPGYAMILLKLFSFVLKSKSRLFKASFSYLSLLSQNLAFP